MNMKIILPLSFILYISAVFAQTQAPTQQPSEERVLAELLLKQSKSLEEQANNAIAANRAKNVHFVQGLERQVAAIELLTKELENQLAQPELTIQLHQIHTIEEQLLHLENRLQEESAIIEHVASGKDNRGEMNAQLIVRAQQLLKDGQDALVKHPQAPEVSEIESEIIIVGVLIQAMQAIQAKPASPNADSTLTERELARQERALRQLIEKANARSP